MHKTILSIIIICFFAGHSHAGSVCYKLSGAGADVTKKFKMLPDFYKAAALHAGEGNFIVRLIYI